MRAYIDPTLCPCDFPYVCREKEDTSRVQGAAFRVRVRKRVSGSRTTS